MTLSDILLVIALGGAALGLLSVWVLAVRRMVVIARTLWWSRNAHGAVVWASRALILACVPVALITVLIRYLGV